MPELLAKLGGAHLLSGRYFSQAPGGFLLPCRLLLTQADEVSRKLAPLRFPQCGETLFQVEHGNRSHV